MSFIHRLFMSWDLFDARCLLICSSCTLQIDILLSFLSRYILAVNISQNHDDILIYFTLQFTLHRDSWQTWIATGDYQDFGWHQCECWICWDRHWSMSALSYFWKSSIASLSVTYRCFTNRAWLLRISSM